MTGFDLDGFLPYQLAVLSARVSRGFSGIYKDRYGISVTEWRLVAHLSQCDQVSVREITAKVDMDKSKVSRAASRLEAAGYLSKTANVSDGRLVALSLSDKGRAMVEELAPLAREYEASILAILDQSAPGFRAAIDKLLASPKI